MILNINNQNPQNRHIEKVVEVLKRGGVISYPTDTNIGFGCDIMNKKAIEKIYAMKQRDKKRPFSFLCADLKNISDYAKVSNFAYKTMKKLTPGPYTFILEGSKLVPKIMLTKRKTAGIRVPENNICIAIIEKLGNPIISTTAKLNGTILTSFDMVYKSFKNEIDIIIETDDIVPNQSSTVIDIIGDEIKIVREGLGKGLI